MLPSVGIPELIIILTIALIVFGPRKLPELGRSSDEPERIQARVQRLKNTLEDEIRVRTSGQPNASVRPKPSRSMRSRTLVPRSKSDQA